jgi:hypothetical protein
MYHTCGNSPYHHQKNGTEKTYGLNNQVANGIYAVPASATQEGFLLFSVNSKK